MEMFALLAATHLQIHGTQNRLPRRVRRHQLKGKAAAPALARQLELGTFTRACVQIPHTCNSPTRLNGIARTVRDEGFALTTHERFPEDAHTIFSEIITREHAPIQRVANNVQLLFDYDTEVARLECGHRRKRHWLEWGSSKRANQPTRASSVANSNDAKKRSPNVNFDT
jgi:hypothetical protein